MTNISGGPGLYLRRQADNLGRYALEQTLQALFGWIPTIAGIALRALAFRLMLHMDGRAAIESGVRLRFANHIRLGTAPTWTRVSISTPAPPASRSARGRW